MHNVCTRRTRTCLLERLRELSTDVIHRVRAGLRGRIRDLPGSVDGGSWPIGMHETTRGYDKENDL